MPQVPGREAFRPPATERAGGSALRYALLVAGTFLAGLPIAYLVSSHGEDSYRAEGTVWVDAVPRRGGSDALPDRERARPEASAWVELLRSRRVLEPVVLDQRLYLRPPTGDGTAFASFTVAEPYRPGTYELRIDGSGEHFVLVDGGGGSLQEGTLGSPIGGEQGFDWTPPRGSFAPGAAVAFSVSGVEAAVRDLSVGLQATLDRDGRFLRVALEGSDPREVADVLDAVMQSLVDVATDLKRMRYDEVLAVLQEQLRHSRQDLEQAEHDLEAFRVDTSLGPTRDRPQPASGKSTEVRLSRQVNVAEEVYAELLRRVEAARLASASLTPDLRILDRASVSERPQRVPQDAGSHRTIR